MRKQGVGGEGCKSLMSRLGLPKTKVEEKRENFSLRKLRKPGEREREKYFGPVVEISHTKREKTFL
jgi:hypothetical protein